jgi:hypothetical protein
MLLGAAAAAGAGGMHALAIFAVVKGSCIAGVVCVRAFVVEVLGWMIEPTNSLRPGDPRGPVKERSTRMHAALLVS